MPPESDWSAMDSSICSSMKCTASTPNRMPCSQVENGTVTLIGATTENPYFEVNKALVPIQAVSACPWSPRICIGCCRGPQRRERGYGSRSVRIDPEAADHLVDVANGDARSLLNALELAVEALRPMPAARWMTATAEESIQQRAVLYDKHGDAHYDTISAFIKSLRGSDPDAALFWLARMVEAGENPRFIFRRMLIAAGEDVGLADPQAIVVVEACAAAFERVGLPEGFYPLAQAALYLAGTEKSNSVLGFFDALKTVRAANKQDVPSHLRDANRDGAAFGDGAGYRYPHAYAEHWVEQQYLPTALQGEVFWQPGGLGWEGERRERMAERRAAQLAAAAELAAEQPLLLSSGPDSPALERWIQRQLGQEGERLHRLRQRLWADVHWRRNDRVLVLGSHSLLWALDPLREALEGGVTLLCEGSDDRSRISAQLELLEPERRPQLITSTAELGPEQRFDWVGGRLGSADLESFDWHELASLLERHSDPAGGLRLLISRAMAGPAGTLQKQVSDSSALDALAMQEQDWLQRLRPQTQALEAAGWTLQHQFWSEIIALKGGQALVQRWLQEDSPYRRMLGKQSADSLKLLRRLLEQHGNDGLGLPLEHQLILGTRTTG